MKQENIIFRPLGSHDIDEIMLIEKIFLNSPEMCMKSDGKDICKSCSCGCSNAITMDGEIIAYTLCYDNEYGVAFVDKCFVKENYRGRRFHKMSLNYCLLELKERRVREVYAMVSPKNKVSLRNFESVGFRKLYEVKCNGFERIVLKHEINN